jgi:hypothetical protein
VAAGARSVGGSGTSCAGGYSSAANLHPGDNLTTNPFPDKPHLRCIRCDQLGTEANLQELVDIEEYEHAKDEGIKPEVVWVHHDCRRAHQIAAGLASLERMAADARALAKVEAASPVADLKAARALLKFADAAEKVVDGAKEETP